MGKTFEILEHTGDAKIRAFGETKEELFLNAMLGMNCILKPKTKDQKSNARKIVLRSADINALLVDFLSEVNYLRQVNMEAYDNARFVKFSDTELAGEVEGRMVKYFGEDIKAVTFHELGIHKNREGLWETAVVFDI